MTGPEKTEPAAGDSRPRVLMETVLSRATVKILTRWLQAAKRARRAHDEDLRRVLEGLITRMRGEVP